HELIRELERDMAAAAAGLEYERAALLRDQITELKTGSGVSRIEPRRDRAKYHVARRGRKKSPIM
ncbi:MAG: UvrB/UvrC motif-containing protein, partial [Terrimicrobiaceae bacterium]